jgi:hypothetical protein
MIPDYEKLGVFYLGKRYDSKKKSLTDELTLYDSKDLTTHGICVGMTGSGKTGLCLSILEEAAIDGIPVIAIDPKGDLGNILLTFPEMQPADFRPWIDEGEAQRAGLTPEQFAKKTAETWKNGLLEWGQNPSRIQLLRDAVDMTIYTPGSQAGLPVTVLQSFQAPSSQLLSDTEGLRDRIMSAVSGLLGLVGIEADPLRSREHILLSTIFENSWRQGKSLDIPVLIQNIQKPPFQKVGVFDLESFYPSKDRFELAILLNNLIASPGFSAWMTGEPLDIPKFLYTAEGKPRLTVFSIAHLSDAERMFFVTLLLNELLSWVRTQPGTSSLRALLYIDEIFGYFPPTANPPSKKPMLTLLKQARAFGVGILLATQNPVDLDYKGLSNTGTWFIGRLQTERDRDRLIEGLLSAEVGAGQSFDRSALSELISGLGKRVFFMKNIHENQPLVFQTRWALSYLRGPLTLPQIQSLMAERKRAVPKPSGISHAVSTMSREKEITVSQKPILAASVEEFYLPPVKEKTSPAKLVYQAFAVGAAKLHFAESRRKLDVWQTQSNIAPFSGDGSEVNWKQGRIIKEQQLDLQKQPMVEGDYASLPSGAQRSENYKIWRKMFESHLFQFASLEIMQFPELKLSSRPDETDEDFQGRVALALRERRDQEVEKLRQRYASKLNSLEERIRRAQEKKEREKSQVTQQTMQTAISVGATVLGALFGRKKISTGTIGRATTAMRGAGKIGREKEDVERAEENLQVLQNQLSELQSEFENERSKIQNTLEPAPPQIEKVQVKPRKSDILITTFGLVWTPWYQLQSGEMIPAF